MAGTNFNITVVHKNGTGVYNISTTSTTFQDLLETVQSGTIIMGDINKLSGNNGTGDEVGFSLTEGGNAVDLNASISTTVGKTDTTIYALYPEPSAEKVTGFYLDGTKYELGGGVTSVNGQTGDVTLKTINNNALVGSGNISLNVIFSGAITPAASSQYEGKIFYNTADKVFYTCDGTQWSAIGSGGFELAPNSPLSPKYRWYGTQAQYDALTQYYTDEVGDTVYYTI